MGHVALVAAQCRRQLADRRVTLTEGEEQPVPHRVPERLELPRVGDREYILFRHEVKS